MGDFGYKELLDPQSKDFTSQRPEDYRLWSKYRSLKFLDKPDLEFYKSGFIPAGAYNVDIEINHNLGYRPVYHAYAIDLNGYAFPLPGMGTDGNDWSTGTRGVTGHIDINRIGMKVGSPQLAPAGGRVVQVGCWVYFDPDNPPEAV